MWTRSLIRLLLSVVVTSMVALVLAIPAAAAAEGGTVMAWGRAEDNGPITVPAGLSGVVAIAAGYHTHLALKDDGTVVGWGEGSSSVPAGLADVVAISAGRLHNLGLKADGTVVAWGANGSGQSSVPAGLGDVVAISGGDYHSLALKADGTVVAWGANGSGQSSVPAGLSDVVAIAAGESHSLALKADGTVVAWGNNYEGQSSVPAGLGDVVAIAAGDRHNLALKADGTVVAWGNDGSGQSSVPDDLPGALAVAGGGAHSLALVPAVPILGTPVSETSVGQGKPFTIWGTLKPRFPAGEQRVKVKLYRRVDGVWRYIRTYDAESLDHGTYSRYRLRISLTQRAKYHVKAYTTETPDWGAAVSRYSKTFTVKRVAALYRPRVPTSVRAGTTFSAWSYLKPRFPAGAKTVKVKLYRYRNGWWRYGPPTPP